MIFWSSIVLLLPAASAFSSQSFGVPLPPSVDDPSTGNKKTAVHQEAPPAAATRMEAQAATAAPWRVVLDIGREPLSPMPFDWARSGCRMPIVVPCDFLPNKNVVPRSDVVSFTGPDGAVVKPIEGGNWEADKEKGELSLTFTFPEFMARRDVTIDAGTTMTLRGKVYPKSELDKLNQAFYEARDKVWSIGGELNEISRRNEAPKKWNFETNRWEKRYLNESILSQVSKRISLLGAQAVQQQKSNQRPNPKTLSDRGPFPGFENDDICMQKEGVITIPTGKGGDAVIGKWSAEPILKDRPVSYSSR